MILMRIKFKNPFRSSLLITVGVIGLLMTERQPYFLISNIITIVGSIDGLIYLYNDGKTKNGQDSKNPDEVEN